MAAKKPSRTFTGTVGVASIGANGPEAIKTDLTALTYMFDPLQTHDDGTPGGIHKDNLQSSGSGILTEDDGVILEDANGDLTVTRDVIATRNVAGVAGNFSGTVTAAGFSGPLTGNVTGNCSGSSGSCTGNAATATQLVSGKWVEVASGSVSTIAGIGTLITLPYTGGEHVIYAWSVTCTSHIEKVYEGYHPTQNHALLQRGSHDQYDVLMIVNKAESSRTFEYKVWAWV